MEASREKDITIYDIARVVNVSPATVSRGLKNHPGIRQDTRRKIQEAAKKMGYQHNTFASNLRQKKTNTIGVIVPRLNSYFMSTVISGMEKVANARGYNLIISQSQENIKRETAGISTMFNSRVDGLLVSLASNTQAFDHFNILFKKGIPVVFFDRVFFDLNCTCIIIDNRRAGYDATKHLIAQGCKRIVHIGGDARSNVYADRCQGYKDALLESGITPDTSLIMSNNLSDQAGAEAIKEILKMNPLPDGIFAANDTLAVACIRELKASGVSVPDKMAVVGFNDDPVSRVIDPNLTTIHYPGYEMGEAAAATLINKLQHQPMADLSTIVLRHELIVRGSSLKKK